MLCWVCDSACVWKTVLEASNFLPTKVYWHCQESLTGSTSKYTFVANIVLCCKVCCCKCICKHLLGILHHYLIMFSLLFSSSGFFSTLFSSRGCPPPVLCSLVQDLDNPPFILGSIVFFLMVNSVLPPFLLFHSKSTP